MTAYQTDIAKGIRFKFGHNWQRFLSTLDEENILEAERSLKDMFNRMDLSGLRFLDIGSGSGLFSLAARRLGAKVHSVDYDLQSIECTKKLKQRYYANDEDWIIEEGSVLDENYLKSLLKFDVVYSWGVLHHTGDLLQALRNAAIPLAKGGLLYITIYNDQGMISQFWKSVKRFYCANIIAKLLVILVFVPVFAVQSILLGLLKYGNPLRHFTDYKQKRGMSIYHDWIDWLGGYPFEVAKPEQIFYLYKNMGLELVNLVTTNRLGCNHFIFRNPQRRSPKQDKIKKLEKDNIKFDHSDIKLTA